MTTTTLNSAAVDILADALADGVPDPLSVHLARDAEHQLVVHCATQSDADRWAGWIDQYDLPRAVQVEPGHHRYCVVDGVTVAVTWPEAVAT